MPTDRRQCCRRVFSNERWDFKGHLCALNATLTHEGKSYCKRHYPPNVAAKEAAQRAENERKWQAERAEWAAKDKAAQHQRACLEAIASIGGDPATVQELVAALRLLTCSRHFHVEAARAVLAKLPEVK